MSVIGFTACNPNEDLYNMLDEMEEPYNEVIEYTLTESDYNFFDEVIADHNAFNDTMEAKDFIPDFLASEFLALNLGSRAKVTYNHLLLSPDWWDAGFGYVLTDEDYEVMIGGGVDYFTETNPASDHIPEFLNREYPPAQDASEGDQFNIIYNFYFEGEYLLYLDTYEYDGENWFLVETVENIPYIGHELTSEDYQNWGGAVASNNYFNEDYPPENYIPVYLKNKFPYSPVDDEKVVKYKYNDGSETKDMIDKYVFDGTKWNFVSYIEERTEQYVFGEMGWAFDPTVIHIMSSDDYLYLAEIDPIPHPTYDDFGYYYGASAYYGNFDVRSLARRLETDDDGNYYDPELAEIYNNEGVSAALDEMYRRILEEGLILLLQHRYPDAVPQVGGIDVHYIVQFETFGDGFMRTYPEAEYKCVEAGDPPQFEFINWSENDDDND